MYVRPLSLFSVDGQLGCFHILVIVNSAAMSIAVHESFQIMVFSTCPEMGLKTFLLYMHIDQLLMFCKL